MGVGTGLVESTAPQKGNLLWKSLLDLVVEKAKKDTSTCALIDEDAPMAGGRDNIEVARYLAEHLDTGVIYFDIAQNEWWVRDKCGRAWPKHSSPIHKRDGFVYFDESRTRGADMKLNTNSCACGTKQLYFINIIPML